MDYMDYEKNTKKKVKKEKKKKKEKDIERVEENIYKDYLDDKKEIDLDDNEKVEYDDIKFDTKEDIENRKNQKKKNSIFYTIVGIIFALLILVVLGFIIYTNYIKK